VSLELLDKLAGPPEHYCSKILSPRGERTVTMEALGWLFNGLGIKAQLVDDPETLALAQPRMKKRDTKVVHNGAVTLLDSHPVLQLDVFSGGGYEATGFTLLRPFYGRIPMNEHLLPSDVIGLMLIWPRNRSLLIG
jgi:hypothetical protein